MTKKEKIDYCKCGGKIALCQTFCYSIEPDQEPFINGKFEQLEEITLDSPITITAHVCIKCKEVKDVNAEWQ
jgi:hypothetical protein